MAHRTSEDLKRKLSEGKSFTLAEERRFDRSRSIRGHPHAKLPPREVTREVNEAVSGREDLRRQGGRHGRGPLDSLRKPDRVDGGKRAIGASPSTEELIAVFREARRLEKGRLSRDDIRRAAVRHGSRGSSRR